MSLLPVSELPEMHRIWDGEQAQLVKNACRVSTQPCVWFRTQYLCQKARLDHTRAQNPSVVESEEKEVETGRWLGLLRHQHSSTFSEKPCLSGIKQRKNQAPNVAPPPPATSVHVPTHICAHITHRPHIHTHRIFKIFDNILSNKLEQS